LRVLNRPFTLHLACVIGLLSAPQRGEQMEFGSGSQRSQAAAGRPER
jgi:hypothetical protein